MQLEGSCVPFFLASAATCSSSHYTAAVLSAMIPSLDSTHLQYRLNKHHSASIAASCVSRGIFVNGDPRTILQHLVPFFPDQAGGGGISRVITGDCGEDYTGQEQPVPSINNCSALWGNQDSGKTCKKKKKNEQFCSCNHSHYNIHA